MNEREKEESGETKKLSNAGNLTLSGLLAAANRRRLN